MRDTIKTTVTCPKCDAAFILKYSPYSREKTHTCSSCGTPIPLPSAIPENDSRPPQLPSQKKQAWWLPYLIGAVGGIVITIVALLNIPTSNTAIPGAANRVANVHSEGETVSVGYMTYSVGPSQWLNRLSELPLPGLRPNAIFLAIEITVRNDDKEPRTIPRFELVDEKGATYETSGSAPFLGDAIGPAYDLNPSVTTKGRILFDVPKERVYRLKLLGGFWSKEDAYIQLNPRPANQ